MRHGRGNPARRTESSPLPRRDHRVFHSVYKKHQVEREEHVPSGPAYDSSEETVQRISRLGVSGSSSSNMVPMTPPPRNKSLEKASQKIRRAAKEWTRRNHNALATGSSDISDPRVARFGETRAQKKVSKEEEYIKTRQMKEVRIHRRLRGCKPADTASMASSPTPSRSPTRSNSEIDSEPVWSEDEDEDYTELSSEIDSGSTDDYQWSSRHALPSDYGSRPEVKYFMSLPPLKRIRACGIEIAWFSTSRDSKEPAKHQPVSHTGVIGRMLWSLVVERLYSNLEWSSVFYDMLQRGECVERTCIMSMVVQAQTGKVPTYREPGKRRTDFACNNCVRRSLPCARLIRYKGVPRLSVASLPRAERTKHICKDKGYFVRPSRFIDEGI